jgi:hypothetical protein
LFGSSKQALADKKFDAHIGGTRLLQCYLAGPFRGGTCR